MSWATGTCANASEGPTTTWRTLAPRLAGARARQACFRRFRTRKDETEQVDGARAVRSTTVTCVVFVLVSNWSTAPSNFRASVLACLALTGVGGCVRLANLFVPYFEAQGRGSFLVSGATMALRGGAGFACMAPVKVALRSYAQSLSAAYHPRGVHVAHVVIDGVIDSPNTRPWGANVTLMDPMHLAEAFVALHEQPPTCWAHEIQLGPFKGTIGQRL